MTAVSLPQSRCSACCVVRPAASAISTPLRDFYVPKDQSVQSPGLPVGPPSESARLPLAPRSLYLSLELQLRIIVPGSATFACTRSGCLFCIPKRVPAAAHLRSARTHLRKSLAYPRRDAVPFGFCSGGFSSTSSLRSGQRGSTEVERRSLPGGRSFPLRAPSRFYPRGSDESADSSCASLSASAGASVAATSPPVAVLKHHVAATLADLRAGHGCRLISIRTSSS
jgi:hypothetical protein